MVQGFRSCRARTDSLARPAVGDKHVSCAADIQALMNAASPSVASQSANLLTNRSDVACLQAQVCDVFLCHRGRPSGGLSATWGGLTACQL